MDLQYNKSFIEHLCNNTVNCSDVILARYLKSLTYRTPVSLYEQQLNAFIILMFMVILISLYGILMLTGYAIIYKKRKSIIQNETY